MFVLYVNLLRHASQTYWMALFVCLFNAIIVSLACIYYDEVVLYFPMFYLIYYVFLSRKMGCFCISRMFISSLYKGSHEVILFCY